METINELLFLLVIVITALMYAMPLIILNYLVNKFNNHIKNIVNGELKKYFENSNIK